MKDLVERLRNYVDDLDDCAIRVEAAAALESQAKRIAEMKDLLRDCAECFSALREANVFVWPNHPMNPETRIAAALKETPRE